MNIPVSRYLHAFDVQEKGKTKAVKDSPGRTNRQRAVPKAADTPIITPPTITQESDEEREVKSVRKVGKQTVKDSTKCPKETKETCGPAPEPKSDSSDQESSQVSYFLGHV